MATMIDVSEAGQPLLFDSNILILHLRYALDDATTKLLDTAVQNKLAAISVITRSELLAWSHHTDESLETAKSLLTNFDSIRVDTTIADTAARLRRNLRVKLPDALIAATALETQRTLVTANVRDFEKMTGLSLFAA
jgi:predicted nucleic acid-binding protein